MLFGDEHVKRYRETEGAEGHEWQGTVCLVLRTTGRKSGKPRDNALIYGETQDGGYVVVASKGGAPDPPAWYLNLTANPEVDVQVGGDRFAAHARDATPEERPALWRMMAGRWPAYDDYQRKTDREIQVVVLERA